jgi:hypothetical protein
VLQDKFAVACVMTVELKAGFVRHQGLEKRLALRQREVRDVKAGEVQEIEGIDDEPYFALAVSRRLGMGKAGQSGVVDAAELAVDIGGLQAEVRECGDDTGIFRSPVEAGPGQKLHAAVVDARGHAKSVEFDFVQPLRPRRRLFDRL